MTEAQAQPVIELEDVSKRYAEIVALDRLSAKIGGQIIGLLGPNGAGKSTMIKTLLGFTHFEGSARVLGLDVRSQLTEIRDRIGYMPETDSHLAQMNAVELCTYAGELSGLPRSEAMQRAHAALYYANLEDKRYLKVDGYSTGMKQRVKLAQALVHDPELLFLDEPTNGLDPAGRQEMLDLIAELPKKRDCTIVLSTHLLPDVERVCDQVMVMNEGRLVFSGTLGQLRGDGKDGSQTARYEVRVKDGADRLVARLSAAGCTTEPTTEGIAVLLPTDQDADLIWRESIACDVQVRQLQREQLSLESAFLRTLES